MKINSYVGFAIKSNKVLIGQSLIKHSKQQIFCILLDSSSSQNLIDLANNVANKHNCEALIVQNLEELTHINNVKIIAITDPQLAKAVVENKEK
jgi:ribosomal protein L7Ae-like RNA K-turn-binding protein